MAPPNDATITNTNTTSTFIAWEGYHAAQHPLPTENGVEKAKGRRENGRAELPESMSSLKMRGFWPRARGNQ
jgi:hypothetical protein